MATDRLHRDNCPECAVQDNTKPDSQSVRAANTTRKLILMQAEITIGEVLFGSRVEIGRVMRDLDDPEFVDDESQKALKDDLREKVGIAKGIKMAEEVLSLMQDPHNKTSFVDRGRVLGRFTIIPHQSVDDALGKIGRTSVANSILFGRASAAYMAAFDTEGAERF